jgi:preprotein translocase subunit SecG
MAVLAVWAWVPSVLSVLLFIVSVFLILLVLIQKGKGGGLAGAFGGAGGSSAFGSRAGDAFTRITIYVAAVWLLLIMLVIKTLPPSDRGSQNQDRVAPSGPPPEQNEGGS